MILCKPLTRRDSNGPLRVIIPARISTPNQDAASIAAQHFDAERWLRSVYHEEIEIRALGEQASGWLIDRPTMIVASGLVEFGWCDAVVVTELREVYRNPGSQWQFVQLCLDHKTRFISIADNIDTAADDWETLMHTASLRHGMSVPETRRRVRRSADHAFQQGGMVMKVRFGYRKLTKEESASGQFGTPGLRVAKRPECTPVIHEMRRRILNGQSPWAVADWLNQQGMTPGPYAKSKKWSGKLVSALLRDPILRGRRRFRSVVYRQIYKTGKHRRERNENGPSTKDWPELVHLTADEQSELVAALDARRRSKPASGRDHRRYGIPRTRSLWPGQHARCGVCGGLMYRYGNFLKCQNAVPNGPRSCWNHVQVPFDILKSKVLVWINEVLNDQPHWHAMIVNAAWDEFQAQRRRRSSRTGDVDARIAELERQAANLAEAIRDARNKSPTLVKEILTVERQLDEARSKKKVLDYQASQDGFYTRDDVAAMLPDAITRLAETSFDFADLLRRLVPNFVIEPVQAVDSGQVRPRGRLTLRLDHWRGDGETSFEQSTVLDLFEPPVHILNLELCLQLRERKPDLTLKQLAAELGIGHMTVKRAFDYARRMHATGATEPYVQLREQPNNASRWIKRTRLSA